MKLKSGICLFFTAMIWGFAFVAQRVGAEYLSAMTYNGIRFVLGALSLLPVLFIFDRHSLSKENRRATLRASILCGIILATASTLQQWGIEISGSAGKAGFITGLYIVLVPIAGLLFLKKRTGIWVWLGAASAVVGLYLLSMTGSEVFGIGDLLLIIGAFFWTAHILCIDSYTKKGIPPLYLAFGQFAVSGILNLIGALFFERITLDAMLPALVPLLYGGVMSVGVAYTLQIVGQKDADPTAASIILSLESVFSCLGAVFILGERMELSNYIGCIFILAGIVLAQIPQNNSADKKQLDYKS